MNDRAGTLLGGRRERIERILSRELALPWDTSAGTPLSEEDRAHLRGDAEDLYWNELEWEHITGEEGLGEGALPELAFPGFLAFVRGLLLEEVLPDAKAPAQPRPDVVRDILRFLATRILELEEGQQSEDEEEEDKLRGELSVTSRLVDLVLYRLHGLTPSDVERVEAAQVRH